MENKLITIEQARLKLGEKGKQMTDQQIQKLLDLLYSISNRSINWVIQSYAK